MVSSKAEDPPGKTAIRGKRIVTGLVVAGIVLGVAAIDHLFDTKVATSSLIVALLCVALSEVYGLFEAGGIGTRKGPAVIAAAALLLLRAFAEPLGLSAPEARSLFQAGVALALVLPLFGAIAVAPPQGGPKRADLVGVAATSFGFAYVVFLGSFLLELRLCQPPVGTGDSGLLLCLLLVTVVKVGDTSAYFVGRALGRRKLSWVSPKKTWEGSVASMAAAIVVAVGLGVWLGYDWRIMAGLGLLADLAGQGGDLVESYVKRAVGAKDSAATFGEMGGVLDVLDALLLAAPVAYVWVDLFLLG